MTRSPIWRESSPPAWTVLYIDWDGDGQPDNPSPAQDVNFDGLGQSLPPWYSDTFTGYNDWTNIRLDQISANGLKGGLEDLIFLDDDFITLAGDDEFISLTGDDEYISLTGDDEFISLTGDDEYIGLTGDDEPSTSPGMMNTSTSPGTMNPLTEVLKSWARLPLMSSWRGASSENPDASTRWSEKTCPT